MLQFYKLIDQKEDLKNKIYRIVLLMLWQPSSYVNKHFEGSCELLSKQCDVMSISVISILHLSPVTSLNLKHPLSVHFSHM